MADMRGYIKEVIIPLFGPLQVPMVWYYCKYIWQCFMIWGWGCMDFDSYILTQIKSQDTLVIVIVAHTHILATCVIKVLDIYSLYYRCPWR